MPASNSKKFARDLAKGKAFEDKVFLKLQSLGFEVRKPLDTEEKGWDLEIRTDAKENWKTVEIKCDYMSLITNNIALETHYKGQLSGISLSGIDIWIHGIGNTKAFMIPFTELHRELSSLPKEKIVVKNKLGDGSKGILVKVEDFEKFLSISKLDL